jgi:ureidoglycolate lyase
MNLKIEDLTVESFAPFGEVIKQPARAQDAQGPGWTWWGENHVLAGGDRNYAIGYLDLQPADLSFDWAERHMHSDELLIPMGGDCLVYVGPAEYPAEPTHLPELERFRVFRVREGQGVLLNKGVWHGAPMAVDKHMNVAVVLLKDTGKVDGPVVRFEDTPVTIER